MSSQRFIPRSMLGVAILMALGAGCSVKRVPVSDPTSTASGKPYDFQGEAASPPPPAIPAEAASGAPVTPPSLDVPAADLDKPAVEVQDLPAPALAAPPVAAPPSQANVAPGASGQAGYRVQVFAGADADAAERVRREVEAKVGTKAYVAYQAPFYKVRVGNCTSSDGCRELQGRLRDAGYETVWIVADEIEP